MAQIVAVSGNLASGKSTLAQALARHNGWCLFPRSGYDVSYIHDLFQEPRRWAFEAQMSFLEHKTRAVRDALQAPGTAVLDRSIEEDVNVFARYFHRRGWMSDRSYGLYQRYADLVVRPLRQPALVLYCSVPARVSTARLRGRPRSYQELYPADHIEQLHQLYETWWAALRGPMKLRIDTVDTDVRCPATAKDLAARIGAMVLRAPGGGGADVGVSAP
jgi:deoxyadenosine/deoxycytidine kinase